MAAGESDAARADEAAAEEICARVFSGLPEALSWCLFEDDELAIADGIDEDNDERSFSFGSELPRDELTPLEFVEDDPMPLVVLPLVPPLDFDDLELLSLCEDEDDEDEDDDGSLSWPLLVPETLFRFLLYLSFSLVLLLEEEDALVLLLLPGIVLLPTLPEPIPDIPEDDEVVDWLFIPMEPLPPLKIPPGGPATEEEPAELFEALEDFRCFEEDDDDDPPRSPPGMRLLDFMFPLPPLLPPMALPLECGCPEGGSSSFSGDDGASLEFVSWLIGLYGGIVFTLPPFFNLL